MNIKKENIKYVDLINRTITIKLINDELDNIRLTFDDEMNAIFKILEIVKKYNLVLMADCPIKKYVQRDNLKRTT